MILSSMILLITSIAFTIFIALNPVSLGIIVLAIALLLAITFSYSISSWVAFLIFLIYIGGILVIFSYFVAIVPNQNLSIIHIILSIALSIISLTIITKSINIKLPIHTTFIKRFNSLYTRSNIYTLILLASILLFTIIVVVKLTILTKGPLRPFIYSYV